MELPKLLQQHSEKENRPIEVQLNEAKKLAMFFIVYAFAAWGTLFLLFVASVFWEDGGFSWVINNIELLDEENPPYIQITATAVNGSGGVI